jgi:hypothetical protein
LAAIYVVVRSGEVMSAVAEFVEFSYGNDAQLKRVAGIWSALREAKLAEQFADDEFWLGFFDEAARATFWWPTEQERAEWIKLWDATPPGRRATEPLLDHGWDFGSLIDAFRNGDYEILECRSVGPNRARLEYMPWGFPFGGTDCMRALVEAFGCKVERDSAHGV